jgi:hypothetical protein
MPASPTICPGGTDSATSWKPGPDMPSTTRPAPWPFSPLDFEGKAASIVRPTISRRISSSESSSRRALART